LSPVLELANEIDAELSRLERELSEIELLLQQTRIEAERHEGRRNQAAQRLPTLEADPRATPESLAEARDQLVMLTRRAAMMEAQTEVLQGKEKNLRRFREYLAGIGPRVRAADQEGTQGGGNGVAGQSSRTVLAAQEQMRREIARQMHDGPAQSIANIALQAEVVQHLLQRDPQEAERELDQLGQMVQHTLDATKTFIFDVRPMVLDDLGLVATLRRAALEHARRTGTPVRFESVGPDRRLEAEVESSLFRILEDALTGFLAGRPGEVRLRLDWTDEAVRAHVLSHSPDLEPREVEQRPQGEPESADLPPALVEMIREQKETEASAAAAQRQARALPEDVWTAIRARAATVGIEVVLAGDGKRLETHHQFVPEG
jgi:two-component system, NarL family, sensor histidine kinase DegS